MTMVELEDGSQVETNLRAEAVADLNQQPAEPAEPQKVENPEPTEKPAQAEADPVEQAEAPKAEDVPQESETPSRKAKPTPIANLLEKKHELETQLEAERQARLDLEAKLASEAKKPESAASNDRVKQLAETYGLDESLLSEIVSAAREGINPEIPKEVQDLIAERQQEKQMQEEMKAFDSRVSKLASVFKDEPIADVKDKLQELAYSTEKAPDGEPYFQKELSEIYFAFIKPEVEAGRKTAESSNAGEAIRQEVVDFADIASDPVKLAEFSTNASSEEFAKFQSWQRQQEGSREPLQRSPI
jgi:hypothetical protein